MFVKKALLFIPALLMTSPLLFSCSQKDPNVTYLRVLNSEDYIADGLIEEFEKEQSKDGKKVKVIYETFDTMENMYNTLKTGKTKYDLVCASDYMVQKLVNLDLLEKIDYTQLTNYKDDAEYIRKRLGEIKWGEGDKYNLDDYCLCYMWGTLGLLYNPTHYLLQARKIDPTQIINVDMKTYNTLWDSRYQKTIAIKDSMRDTYAIGLIHSFKEELAKHTDEKERQIIFDYGGEGDNDAKAHIDIIKKDLLTLRNNIFGFEVDSGKEDIVTEKIAVDTAWSGDAVKAIKNAENEKNLKLYYSIPSEGSNLWFDCWTIQKGANKELAYKFLDFLSSPENAIKNMEAIGYTSAIADKGDKVFDYFKSLYEPEPTEANADTQEYDLSYFFGEGHILNAKTEFINRQLSAQFPTKEEADKLMVMKDYGNNNDLILKMWEEVKHEALPTWAIVLFVVEIAIIATAITVIITLRIRNKNRRKERKIKAA